MCYTLESCFPKTENASRLKNSENKLSKNLRLKSNSSAQSSSAPSVSTTFIAQSTGSQCPWIIDLGASDHISGNSSLFTSMSSPEFPHLITLANGAKLAPKGVGQVSLSPSLNLKFVFFVPYSPYNLISLSQLTKSLNCSVTFDVDSLVIQERGMGWLIGVGHES